MSETVTVQPPRVATDGNGFVCPLCGSDVDIQERQSVWGRVQVSRARVEEDGSAYAEYESFDEDDSTTEHIALVCENNRGYLHMTSDERYCPWEYFDFNFD